MSKTDMEGDLRIALAIFVVVIVLVIFSQSTRKECPSQATITVAKTWAASEGGLKTSHTEYYLSDPDGVTYQLVYTGNTPMAQIFGRIQVGQTIEVTVDQCQAEYYRGITPIILDD